MFEWRGGGGDTWYASPVRRTGPVGWRWGGRASSREPVAAYQRATGRPIAHLAKDLGIHKEALRGWVRQAEADRGERDDRPATAEQDELNSSARCRSASPRAKRASKGGAGGVVGGVARRGRRAEHVELLEADA
ncbi:transposase [Streptomyces halobius]|uniref:Transposase n=1 Tax=Streptomyces halobius TaxID=2879846 RepID=A0ABY4LYV7_9ACTN|nr:transposase [Streptomyces halobius]